MLNVSHRVDFITLCHMFNISKGTAPSYLKDCICRNRHYNVTRSRCEFILPSVKTQGKKSFVFNGVRLWNDLSVEIRKVETKIEFKVKVKEAMFRKMKQEEESDFVYY